jgi:ribosomal protein S18 acetylase RimI-like enzyme
MKRLYVRPEFQGKGIGTRLCEEILRVASVELGYAEMVLDTIENLGSANAVYCKLGFQQIPAYYYNPHPGVVYFRKQLQLQS